MIQLIAGGSNKKVGYNIRVRGMGRKEKGKRGEREGERVKRERERGGEKREGGREEGRREGDDCLLVEQ